MAVLQIRGKFIEFVKIFIKESDFWTRLPKFALVGLAGFLVNQGTLFLNIEYLGIAVKYAGLIAIETAIIFNFLLNNFWTWRDTRTGSFLSRLIKYHGVTAFSGSINYGLLLLLTNCGLYYLLANMIGIGIGMIINFIFNHFWTFSKP